MKINGKEIPVQVGQIVQIPDGRQYTITGQSRNEPDMWHLDGNPSSNNIEHLIESGDWKLVGGPGCDPGSFAKSDAVFPSTPAGLFSSFQVSPTADSHPRGCKGCIWHGDASGKSCFCSMDYQPEPAPVARAPKAPEPVKPVEPFDIVAACDKARTAYTMTTEGHGLSLPGTASWGVRFYR